VTWRTCTDKHGNRNIYAITNGTHNICRVVVNGRESFELWQRQNNGWVFVSRHATADEARAASGA
jgi:hypothetical protein